MGKGESTPGTTHSRSYQVGYKCILRPIVFFDGRGYGTFELLRTQCITAKLVSVKIGLRRHAVIQIIRGVIRSGAGPWDGLSMIALPRDVRESVLVNHGHGVCSHMRLAE